MWPADFSPPKAVTIRQGENTLWVDLERPKFKLNDGLLTGFRDRELDAFGAFELLLREPNKVHSVYDLQAVAGIDKPNSFRRVLENFRKAVHPIQINTDQNGGLILVDDGQEPELIAQGHGIRIDKANHVFYEDQAIDFHSQKRLLRSYLESLLNGDDITMEDNITHMHFIRKALAQASESEYAPQGLDFIETDKPNGVYRLRESPVLYIPRPFTAKVDTDLPTVD